jgi:hypothetical protein
MVKALLVGPDVEFGEGVLAALDAAKFPVTVALWVREREEDNWELVISTPRYPDRDAHLQFFRALGDAVPPGNVPIRLESNRRPFIKALRKIFGKAASVKGVRLGLQMIGGTWITDAYVYRVK